ncbi:MAG: hypothetical protein IT457_10500 [Planctomycetes bacterium]|nr:hypothetical protein [Planctomycetota bacterium]
MVKPRNSTPRHDDGFAILECLFAMLVLTILAASLFAGERGGAHVARRTLEENLVTWSHESRLDELRALPTLEVGQRTLVVPPREIELGEERTVETVTLLEPNLYEVVLETSWKPLGAESPAVRSVTTRLAKEGAR